MEDEEALQWMVASCTMKAKRLAMEVAFGKENIHTDCESRSVFEVTRAALCADNHLPTESTFFAIRRLYRQLGMNRMREVCFAMCAELFNADTRDVAQIFFFEGSERNPFRPEYVEDDEENAKREAYTANFVRMAALWQELQITYRR